MDSLGFDYGDSIYINDLRYSLNQTVPGEDNVMRIPSDARAFLGLNVQDVIRDSDVRNIFKNLYASKNIPVENYSNLNVEKGVFIRTEVETGRIVNVYIDNQRVASTKGVFENGTYGVYINGQRSLNINFNDQNPENSYYLYLNNRVIRIEIEREDKADMNFSQSK